MSAHSELDLVHALADGELPAGEAERLREHVAGCGECQRELDDVIQLRMLQPRGARVIELKRKPVWTRPAPWAAAALAASVLFAVSALRGRQKAERELEQERSASAEALQKEQRALADERKVRAGLEEELQRLQKPQAGLPVLALRAERGAGGVAKLSVGAGQWFVISVDREDPPRFDAYAAGLFAADGREVWRDESVKPVSREQIAVAFNSGAVPPGEYRLRVEGVARAGRERVGEFRFVIEHP
jgi:hypothetical protein